MIAIVFAAIPRAHAATPLPRSTPEAQGTSSQAILDFVDAVDKINTLHSFMIVRHGQVIAEGWWKPETADKPHVLWSLSKSFNSTAVGLAIEDGKLSLDDPVLKFFPDDAPAEISDNRRYLHSLDASIKVENFAYPFGYGSFVRKHQLRSAFQSCRSIMPGVNSGAVDLQFLRALPLIDRRIDRDAIERAFDEAQTTNGWLIFYSHDVADRPSLYGCSPALMNHALEAAGRRKIPVLNMAEALLCAGA